MRIVLDGLSLNTIDYAEGAEISFACCTRDDGNCCTLSDALADQSRVMELYRGAETIQVRPLEHEVWPPCSQSLGGSLHRHTIRLELLRSSQDAAAAKRDEEWARDEVLIGAD